MLYRLMMMFSVVAMLACGASDGSTPKPSADAGGEPDAAPLAHRLTLRVSMHTDGEQLPFITASSSVAMSEATYYTAKPWALRVYEAGADPGTDRPIYEKWGVVPDDLALEITPERTFPDGPYDVVFVLFATTKITDAERSGARRVANLASGDVSSFTTDHSEVRSGDPDFLGTNGLIRVNVEGADATLSLENRTSSIDDPPEVRRASFVNTLLRAN